ncbi:MAG TPA: sugar ABC transporter permease [Thermoanaerobaculia bacterium]|jgi:multiple sugar transport system permease protein|nr:sugar ABC transporter permease [Thermoanaerobaculia bacterium]
MKTEARAALVLLTPAMALITIFFVIPVVGGFLLSLTDFDLYSIGDPGNTCVVGAANYTSLLNNPLFWRALTNTLYFSFVGGPITIAVALGAALLLNAKLARFKAFFRTIYFAPVVTTIVGVAIVWKYIYHPRVGLLNRLLDAVGIAGPDWLGDPRWAMPALILMAVWRGFGYATVIFLAGLQNVPDELYEAATIDGAGPWKQFLHVTVPQLGPTFVFVGIITAIGFLQVFAEPYVMTPDGGPLNATLTIVMLMYREGFRWWNMGYAAAVAFILFALVLLATIGNAVVRRMR